MSPRTLLVPILIAVATACGRDDSPKSAPQSPRDAQPASPSQVKPPASRGSAPADPVLAPPPAALAPMKRLFEMTSMHRDEWLIDNLRRIDPQVDGWPLEVFHDAARPVLERMIALAWSNAGASLAASGWFAAEFEGASVLRPAELETVFEDGNTVVRRAREFSGERLSLDQLEVWSRGAREPFAGATPRVFVHIDRVDVEKGGFATDVRVQLDARIGAGALQQNLTARVSWTPGTADVAPRLRSWTTTSFEECRVERTNFGEHTARWIGRPNWLEREFRHGLGDFYFRQDKLTGNHFLGLHGLAVGDVNGDGLDDVYMCTPGGFPNRLLLQQPDGSVRDGTSEAKLAYLDNTRSALIVDLDADGDQDVVAGLGPYLAISYNDGRGVFTEQMIVGNTALGPEDIFSIAAADPDNDGDLDLYCCRYVQGGMISGVPRPYHDANNGATNLYWRNEGGRRFVNATDEVGFGSVNHRYSLAALWIDFDLDGDLDLYVANDFGRNNLFVNESGRFRDIANERGAEDMAAGMGVTSADFDLDGVPDLYVSNMDSDIGRRIARQSDLFMGGRAPELRDEYVRHARGNTLLRGVAGGRFEDVTEAMGVAPAGWAWGAMFVDFDSDGYEDLLVPNGFITNDGTYDIESFFWRRVVGQSLPDEGVSEDYRRAWVSMQLAVMEEGASYNGSERNTAFRNLRGASFADVSSCAGFDRIDDSRSIARVDWDDDGRVDVLLRSRTGPRMRFLRNQDTSANHFVAVQLRGTTCHPDAIGARVELEVNGRLLRKTLFAGEGFLSQSSKTLTFGLGDAQRITTLKVVWPDGTKSQFEDLPVDTRFAITQGADAPRVIAPRNVRTFADAAPAEMTPNDESIERFVLVEKIPMREFAPSLFEGGPRKIATFAGAPLLIQFWSIEDPNSLAIVEQLTARSAELKAAGLRWIALSIDDGPKLGEARRWAQAHGVSDAVGALDGDLRKQIQVLYIEALAESGRVELPAAMLLDAAGQWVYGYLGLYAIPTLLTDVASLATVDVKARQTAKLMGGRWVLKHARDWELLIAVFREIGAVEIADMFRQHATGATEER